MKSRRPDGAAPRGATWLALLALVPLAAAAAEPSPPLPSPPSSHDACATTRDRALAALESEALALANALDADAALADAPTYEIEKAADALRAEIEQERRDVAARYRRCLAGQPYKPLVRP